MLPSGWHQAVVPQAECRKRVRGGSRTTELKSSAGQCHLQVVSSAKNRPTFPIRSRHTGCAPENHPKNVHFAMQPLVWRLQPNVVKPSNPNGSHPVLWRSSCRTATWSQQTARPHNAPRWRTWAPHLCAPPEGSVSRCQQVGLVSGLLSSIASYR